MGVARWVELSSKEGWSARVDVLAVGADVIIEEDEPTEREPHNDH